MTATSPAAWRARYPRAVGPTPLERAWRWGGMLVVQGRTLAGFVWLDITPQRFFSGFAELGRVALLMLPPSPGDFPMEVAHVLYIFESNVRSSTILGIVGAGGIGFQLSDRIRALRWDEASFIILMILALVAAIDALSGALRRRLTSGAR